MDIVKSSIELLNTKRTAHRAGIRAGAAVLLLLLLLPYLITALGFKGSGAYGGALEGQKASRIRLQVESGGCVRRMDMETYLPGRLAAVIPVQYEEETLKAQAILLRTGLIREYKKEMENGAAQGKVCLVSTDTYFNIQQMRDMWGSEFAVNYKKICRAVKETAGIYVTYGGEPVLPSYFRVSTGKTRDIAETGKGGDYPYLKSVSCPKDYLAEDYLSQGQVTGLGHGFGMSQFAANEMAKTGSTYHEIITYFFTNIAIDKFE